MVCTRGQLQRAAVEQPTRPDPSPTAEDQSDRLKQAPTPVLAERSLNTLPMSGPQKAAGEALPGRSPTPVAPPKKLTVRLVRGGTLFTSYCWPQGRASLGM